MGVDLRVCRFGRLETNEGHFLWRVALGRRHYVHTLDVDTLDHFGRWLSLFRWGQILDHVGGLRVFRRSGRFLLCWLFSIKEGSVLESVFLSNTQLVVLVDLLRPLRLGQDT